MFAACRKYFASHTVPKPCLLHLPCPHRIMGCAFRPRPLRLHLQCAQRHYHTPTYCLSKHFQCMAHQACKRAKYACGNCKAILLLLKLQRIQHIGEAHVLPNPETCRSHASCLRKLSHLLTALARKLPNDCLTRIPVSSCSSGLNMSGFNLSNVILRQPRQCIRQPPDQSHLHWVKDTNCALLAPNTPRAYACLVVIMML